MDGGTLQDYLNDVIEERNKALGEVNALRDYVGTLTKDRDHWRSLAERAMDLLEEANRVLATIQEAIKND
jgi:type VI protein secretion system component VasF